MTSEVRITQMSALQFRKVIESDPETVDSGFRPLIRASLTSVRCM